MREKNFVGSDGSPISRSEKLKVEFAPLVSAMHRAMTGFAPGGNWGGVAELSHLVDEPGALLRNQYGPSVYDHAPTLHGFLSIYSLLKPLPVAMIAPSPQLDEDALAFATAVQVSFSD